MTSATHTHNMQGQGALCPHFGVCGGCRFQDMPKADYQQKQITQLQKALQNVCGPDVIKPLISAPFNSRRRTTWAAQKTKGGLLHLGYHPAQSHDIVPINTCRILTPRLQQALPLLRDILTRIPFKQAHIALTDTPMGVDLVWRGTLSTPGREAWVEAIKTQTLFCRISCGDDEGTEALFTHHTPVMTWGKAQVPLPPGAFLQASAEGEGVLQNAVLSLCRGPQVLDLFAGLGTFSLPLAQQGQQVTAVDTAIESLHALRTAGQPWGLRVMARNLFTQPLGPDILNTFDTVVLDPPRAGAYTQCRALAESLVPQVVYVSCNPTSFAQDAVVLQKAGFMLHTVQPVDQFIWSNHLELVADFRRFQK